MIKSLLAITLLVLAISSDVFAQSAVEKIKARAAEINELKALLANPDPSIRIAAIDIMQNSEDLAMREMGFNAGINSSDESVLAVTIMNKFKLIKNFNIEMIPATKVPADKQKVLTEMGGRLGVNIKKYDQKTATFENSTTYSGNVRTSSISGTIIQLNTAYCNGALILDDELFFSGKLTCNDVVFDAKAQLF